VTPITFAQSAFALCFVDAAGSNAACVPELVRCPGKSIADASRQFCHTSLPMNRHRSNFTKRLAIPDTDLGRLTTAPQNAQDERCQMQNYQSSTKSKRQ
jgi:hypothetical protein